MTNKDLIDIAKKQVERQERIDRRKDTSAKRKVKLVLNKVAPEKKSGESYVKLYNKYSKENPYGYTT